jgi:hypothetical protein
MKKSTAYRLLLLQNQMACDRDPRVKFGKVGSRKDLQMKSMMIAYGDAAHQANARANQNKCTSSKQP